jgi:hypothetical protein
VRWPTGVVARASVLSLSLFTALLALHLHGSTGEIAPADGSPAGRIISLPDFWGANAIWGATGNDRRGHIWLGITSNDEKTGSAHLFELDPATNAVVDRGNVVAELERLHLRRPGERQMKIHSRIVEMPDGHLYFSSMDESGENPNGSTLPTWGGHLWRLRSPGFTWEHLAVTKQALIAVAAGGPYVYALGYFDHVVYQYDTRSGTVNAKTVGSVGGHISRNFFADGRGHVFVPRLTRSAAGQGQRIDVSLVEFGPDLREVASFPLSDYLERGPDDSHGIVAIHPDGGGGWYFATGKGRLYRVEPTAAGSSTLTNLGWFHPSGSRYVATMFRDPQRGTLHGAAVVPQTDSRRFEWITRDSTGSATVSPIPIGDAPQFSHPTMVYGSMTRDTRGRFYVVGGMRYKPVLLQITSQ